MLCIETSTSLGLLQQFQGAAGEFRGALGYWLQLILSPVHEIFLSSMKTAAFLSTVGFSEYVNPIRSADIDVCAILHIEMGFKPW